MRWGIPVRFFKAVVFVASALAAGVSTGLANDDPAGCVALTIRSEPAAVVRACTQALRAPDLTAPQRATLLLYRGRGYKALQRLDAAAADFAAGLELAPDDVALHVFLGWVAFDRKESAALARITTALAEKFPREASVHDFIGAAAVLRNDLATAFGEYSQALAIDPDNVMALDHRAHLFWRVHDYDHAIKDFAALAASKNPDADLKYSEFYGRKISLRTGARLGRVQLLENMGHTEAIEEALAEFARVEPSAVSYGWWGLFHHRRAQFDRAQAELEKALSYDPDFWFLHNLLGANLLYMHEYERALASFDRAIELNPKSGSSYWQRALTLRALKRTDEAMESAQHALDSEPAFIGRIGPQLVKLGYLQAETNGSDLAPMVHDAVRACMLDEKCW